jgi:hypothetical protein
MLIFYSIASKLVNHQRKPTTNTIRTTLPSEWHGVGECINYAMPVTLPLKFPFSKRSYHYSWLEIVELIFHPVDRRSLLGRRLDQPSKPLDLL